MSHMQLQSCRAYHYWHGCLRRPARQYVITQAQDKGSPSSSSPTPSPMKADPPRPGMVPGRPPVMLGPDGQPLQVVPVEKAGDEAWAGVAAIDGKDDNAFDFSNAALLAGGDAAAIMLFAIIGRINHGEVLNIETLQTALPFLMGWFLTAPFLGAFEAKASLKGVAAAASTAATCWAVGAPLGLMIRGFSKGYMAPTPFIIVSMVATFVLLVGWRSALAATTKEEAPLSPAQKLASRKDKQGNPFEFIQLLMSLTTRW